MRVNPIRQRISGWLIILLFLSSQAAAESVLDYYKKLPEQYLDGQKWALEQRGGKWIIHEEPGYGTLDDPIVDLKNGYIKTVYHGGDGDQSREVALFLTAGGTPVIGISRFYSGLGSDYGIIFLEYRGGAWKEVTSKVMPIRYAAFLNDAFDAKPFEQLLKRAENAEIRFIEAQVRCELPRSGTMVRTSLNIFAISCEDYNDIDRKIVANVRANIRYREIVLNWNMRKGVFEVGIKK